jgi:hypothetical protein
MLACVEPAKKAVCAQCVHTVHHHVEQETHSVRSANSQSITHLTIHVCAAPVAPQSSGSWQTVLRALAALEAVLQRGSSQSCGEVAVMFQSDAQPVRAHLASPHAQVRSRAAAVLALLLGEDAAVTTTATAATAAAAPHLNRRGAGGSGTHSAPAAADLLQLDDDGGLLSNSTTAAAAAAVDGDCGILLLGGEGHAVSQATAVPVAAVAPAGLDDLLGGLDLGTSNGGASSSTTTTCAAAAAAAPTDMFGGLDVAAAPAAGQRGAPPADVLQHTCAAMSALDDLFATHLPQQQQQQQSSQTQHQPLQAALLPDLLGPSESIGQVCYCVQPVSNLVCLMVSSRRTSTCNLPVIKPGH